MKSALLSIFLLLPFGLALAEPGSGTSGGGDTLCERRIHEIRKDLLFWVASGGADGLDFRSVPTFDRGKYAEAILPFLQENAVTIACESPTVGIPEPIKVSGEAKTCRWSKDTNAGNYIRCNTDRFGKTNEAEQYRLVHHEFAGLAGIEPANGSRSFYGVSDQITAFLRKSVVLRLAVGRKFNAELVSLRVRDEDRRVSYAAVLFGNLIRGQAEFSPKASEAFRLNLGRRRPSIEESRQMVIARMHELGVEALWLRPDGEPSFFFGAQKVDVMDAATNTLLFKLSVTVDYRGGRYSHLVHYVYTLADLEFVR